MSTSKSPLLAVNSPPPKVKKSKKSAKARAKGAAPGDEGDEGGDEISYSELREQYGVPKMRKIKDVIVAELLGRLLITLLVGGITEQFAQAGANLSPSFKTIDMSAVSTIALVSGAATTLAVYCAREYSGAHLNPFHTMALAGTRQVTFVGAVIYILSQFAGVVAGLCILAGCFNTPKTVWVDVSSRDATYNFNVFGMYCTVTAISTIFFIFVSVVNMRTKIKKRVALLKEANVNAVTNFYVRDDGIGINAWPSIISGLLTTVMTLLSFAVIGGTYDPFISLVPSIFSNVGWFCQAYVWGAGMIGMIFARFFSQYFMLRSTSLDRDVRDRIFGPSALLSSTSRVDDEEDE